jgi:tRNA1(Val) A37 N6-methylase TrmN6
LLGEAWGVNLAQEKVLDLGAGLVEEGLFLDLRSEDTEIYIGV